MLANTTSNVLRLTLRDLGSTKEDDIPVSLPNGTASAVLKFNEEWVGIDASQAWFWTEEWQARHKTAISELDSGDYHEFDNGNDFVSSLDDLD